MRVSGASGRRSPWPRGVRWRAVFRHRRHSDENVSQRCGGDRCRFASQAHRGRSIAERQGSRRRRAWCGSARSSFSPLSMIRTCVRRTTSAEHSKKKGIRISLWATLLGSLVFRRKGCGKQPMIFQVFNHRRCGDCLENEPPREPWRLVGVSHAAMSNSVRCTGLARAKVCLGLINIAHNPWRLMTMHRFAMAMV